MRITLLLSALLSFLLVCPVVAQQTFNYGQDVTLPAVGPLGADHATVAVNSYGDSFVAYHSLFGTGRHMVEGMGIFAIGNGQFQTGSTAHFALGNQTLNVLGDDTCIKPDVVALSDDSFVVSWSRLDKSGQNPARIEMCRVIMRDGSGAALAAPQIIAPQAGVGYVIDANFDATDSGGMVDLVDLEDGSVAAIYAHQTSRVVDSQTSNTWREYDLRLTRIDWNLDPSDPNFAAAPIALVNDIAFDNPGNHVPRGGQILPDVVLDDNANIVVAYEEFWLNGHGGVSGSNLGRVVVKRFEGFQSATPLMEMNSNFFTRNPSRSQRRPNLSASRFDNQNSVSLTWGHDEIWFLADKIVSRQIHYQPSGAVVQNLYWKNHALYEDSLPAVAHGANISRFTLATRAFANSNALIVARSLQLDMIEIPTAVDFPLRPATALLEEDNGSGGIDQFLFTTYEGANTENPIDFSIHLVIHRVP
ncbi:MAG: hypothetical protein GY747_12280 [Planctomycetes bacterium]|nr:hypothetical protein [Planctomycetota bacterium]MCP4771770.1 hypothetical protein [Planctomycetota bacterium]MCP4860987.1 hypothetical protein [Planctomycetota bacterium]